MINQPVSARLLELLQSQAPQLEALGATPAADDLIVIIDVSADKVKTVTPADLGEVQVYTFDGGTGDNNIVVPSNLADALSIHDGVGDLVVFVTTTGATAVQFKATKLGFFSVAPVVKPASANQAAATTQDLTGTDTVDKAKVTADLLSCKTLVNQLRSDLVSLGLIKGSA